MHKSSDNVFVVRAADNNDMYHMCMHMHMDGAIAIQSITFLNMESYAEYGIMC